MRADQHPATDAWIVQLQADIGEIFHAIDISQAGWRIAALRSACHEFSSTLGSIFQAGAIEKHRGKLAALFANTCKAALVAQHREQVIDGLQRLNVGQFNSQQLVEIVAACLDDLSQTSARIDAALEELTDNGEPL